MAVNDIDFRWLAQIDLLEHEDHVLEPGLLQEVQKFPVRLSPGVRHRENEQNDVSPRHKIFRHHLMLLHHRVRAGRVDDVEIAQKRNWQVPFGQFR